MHFVFADENGRSSAISASVPVRNSDAVGSCNLARAKEIAHTPTFFCEKASTAILQWLVLPF
jgi:hypothetical protein